MSAGEEPVDPCCKDMAVALSFPTGRHFYADDGKLRLLVAQTPLCEKEDPALAGGPGVPEHVAACHFAWTSKPAPHVPEVEVGARE